MKRFSFLFLFAFGLFAAQTHRYIYEFTQKEDSLSSTGRHDYMALDINPQETKFYPYAYVLNDSIGKRNGQPIVGWYPSLPVIFHQQNSNENVSYILIDDGFYTLKTTNPILWILENDRRTVGGLPLQKATAVFGGREWTAWFTSEIPFQEGPYKFRGLPGLIVEISDRQGYFDFKLIRSQNIEKTFDTTDLIERFNGQTPTAINQKIFVKKMIQQYESPLNAVRQAFMTIPNYKFFYGETTISSLKELKSAEDQDRQRIRKNNNPIEKTMMIHYPKN